ncbi:hypothetical protein HFP89_08035 [Wenzhouxiangella sp. XN79A]|uniref:hypothetical protein n=1 Tax=Wenzhouxiangella sp. XN79A TaxID=2724193 RepID=UPI00144AC76C|nr:hypothetical protein [Wenzhouxiangella sp. XN79A]NKI35113.1 hypothetical protein [Wenzhouxiangella sp. XN79A]
MNNEHNGPFHPISHIIMAPAVWFGLLPHSAKNPLTNLIGLGGMMFFIGLNAIAGTALIVFIILSGFDMLGMMLFEWLP